MADVTISGLNPITPSSSLSIPASDGTTTGKVSISQINSLASGVPIGFIGMWSGSVASIPSGWALCNGQTVNGNVTPDLRERFIVGAGGDNPSVSGTTGYNPNDSGGLNSVTLTTNEIPSHTHTYSLTQVVYQNSAGNSPQYRPSGPNSTSNTGAAGGGQSHENRPPYYALAFIMKIS